MQNQQPRRRSSGGIKSSAQIKIIKDRLAAMAIDLFCIKTEPNSMATASQKLQIRRINTHR